MAKLVKEKEDRFFISLEKSIRECFDDFIFYLMDVVIYFIKGKFYRRGRRRRRGRLSYRYINIIQALLINIFFIFKMVYAFVKNSIVMRIYGKNSMIITKLERGTRGKLDSTTEFNSRLPNFV